MMELIPDNYLVKGVVRDEYVELKKQEKSILSSVREKFNEK